MKRKIYIIMIGFIFFCTGCSNIKYSLSINSDYINENLSLKDEEVSQDDLPDNYMPDMSPFEVLFQSLPYESGTDFDGNSYARKTFNKLEEYINGSFLFSKYVSKNAIEITGNQVFIDFTSDNILVNSRIDSIEFSLFVPYYVSSHNADSVSNNTYTWIIKDIQNDSIKISFDMSKGYDYKNNMTSIYIIIGLSVIIIGVIIYCVIKNKKANEI